MRLLNNQVRDKIFVFIIKSNRLHRENGRVFGRYPSKGVGDPQLVGRDPNRSRVAGFRFLVSFSGNVLLGPAQGGGNQGGRDPRSGNLPRRPIQFVQNSEKNVRKKKEKNLQNPSHRRETDGCKATVSNKKKQIFFSFSFLFVSKTPVTASRSMKNCVDNEAQVIRQPSARKL